MILLTGSTGFLGKALVELLKKEKINFKCLVRKKTNRGVQEAVGDLLNFKSISPALKNCSLVIHLANITEGDNIREVNEQGTKNLIDACKKNKVKKLIYISSTAAIDGDDNEYSISKINCERLVKNSKLDYVIVRPSVVFGKGDTKNYGVVEEIVKNSKRFVLYSSGNCLIHPVWVKDLAHGILCCIKLKKFKGQSYTLAGKNPIKYNDFVRLINKKHGYPAKIIYVPYVFSEPLARVIDFYKGRKRVKQNDRTYDLSKEKKELGYAPHSVEEALFSY